MKTTVVPIRLPDSVLKKIDEQAKTENRSRANMIQTIVKDKYEKEG